MCFCLPIMLGTLALWSVHWRRTLSTRIFAILTPTIHIASSAILGTGAANNFSVFVLYHMAVDIIVSGIFSTSTFHRFCSWYSCILLNYSVIMPWYGYHLFVGHHTKKWMTGYGWEDHNRGLKCIGKWCEYCISQVSIEITWCQKFMQTSLRKPSYTQRWVFYPFCYS